MTVREFLHLPPPAPSLNPQQMSSYMRRIWETLQPLRKGKTENVTELTLTANVATTVLNYRGLSPQSVVIFDPKTANAAAELAAGTMYVLTANRANDQWTITHANNAQVDRSYQVAVIG
jgi:hypothetical protein